MRVLGGALGRTEVDPGGGGFFCTDESMDWRF